MKNRVSIVVVFSVMVLMLSNIFIPVYADITIEPTEGWGSVVALAIMASLCSETNTQIYSPEKVNIYLICSPSIKNITIVGYEYSNYTVRLDYYKTDCNGTMKFAELGVHKTLSQLWVSVIQDDGTWLKYQFPPKEAKITE